MANEPEQLMNDLQTAAWRKSKIEKMIDNGRGGKKTQIGKPRSRLEVSK